MVAKVTPTVSFSWGLRLSPKTQALGLVWYKEISVQDLCHSWKIRTGKESVTEFVLGPPADVSSLFDPERGSRISRKAGFPVRSDRRSFFWRNLGASFLPPRFCPCCGFSSSDEWLDTLECTALQCKGDAALTVTLVLGISRRRRRGQEGEKT